MADAVDDFLVHFGVKGMHWGVRRDSSGGRQLKIGANPRRAHANRVAAAKKLTAKKPLSEEHKTLRSTKTKHAKELSDAQLKAAIGRMNLERQYKSLNPHGLSKANKVALGILAVGTTANTAIAFYNSPAGKAITAGIKKALATSSG